MPPRPLVMTDDAALLEDLLRLTAVAGLEPHVSPIPGLADWRAAPLVLLGMDRAASAVRLPRRPGVVLVTRSADLQDYATGIRLGATDVVELPTGEHRLMECLASALVDRTGPPGVVWSVVAGSGGVGASLLASTLAVVAARVGDVLLVEADPYGGGIDLLVGAEHDEGARWPDLDLDSSTARLAETLRRSLPRAHGVSVLAGSRTKPPYEATSQALSSVLEAGRRFARLVVVDVSRAVGQAAEAALEESQRAFLLAPDQVRGVAAAAAVKAWAAPLSSDLQLVVRRSGGSLDPASIAHALALPLAGEMRYDSALTADLERGELPGRRARTPLAKLSLDLLSGLPVPGASQAMQPEADGRLRS